MFLVTRVRTLYLNENYEIDLNVCRLVRVEEAKFLGITIDENLTWKKHIDNVCKRCARNIAVLNKVERFLPEQASYKLYCTFLFPYLMQRSMANLNSPSSRVVKDSTLSRRRILRYINFGIGESSPILFLYMVNLHLIIFEAW